MQIKHWGTCLNSYWVDLFARTQDMPKPEKASPTLFDKSWYNASISKNDCPYPVRLEQEENCVDPNVDENELSVFSHVIEHETGGYESRGYLSGPIEIVTHYAEPTARLSSNLDGYIVLPTVVEEGYVDIKNCKATELLLVESTTVFRSLANSSIFRELGLLLITGCGIPRLTARRFIHRLRLELDINVHLLSDNDTWGYFMYSLLLRGAMGPHMHFPWAAIDEVNYIGMHAGDCDHLDMPESFLRPWKSIWSSRLNALREYECFQSRAWQDELSNFESQKYAVNLGDFIEAAGGTDTFIKDYISPRL